jgi:hypothetical protein
MSLKENIDWARRLHWAWTLVPMWAKLSLLAGLSTILGYLDRLPKQAILFLLTFTCLFAAVFFQLITCALEDAVALSDRRRLVKDRLAAFAVQFSRLYGQAKEGINVDDAFPRLCEP